MSSHGQDNEVQREGGRVEASSEDIMLAVYEALLEKEYNPINQIVGYLLSGDPAYIPRHNNARSLIRKKERDELIEELVRYYLSSTGNNHGTEMSLSRGG